MKLRIQGNALRLRLNRGDVSELERAGKVEAFVQFPGNRRFRYRLETAEVAQPEADFEGECIRIRVPQELAREWTGTDRVGIRHLQAVAGGGELEIVIEKDFQCLHKEDERPDPEAFPNPLLPGDPHRSPADVARGIEGANDD